MASFVLPSLRRPSRTTVAAGWQRCMATHRGKAIFIAATQEHTGKTSVSMALLAGLSQRYPIDDSYTPTSQAWMLPSVDGSSEEPRQLQVSRALIVGPTRRFGPERVSYMKPVGQKHVLVKGKDGEDLKVDKDVAVAKEHFRLQGPYNAMSPLVLHKGYTKDFLDGKIDPRQQEKVIRDGFEELIESNDFVVVEGTGHTGVGSIVGMNNADVASLLGLDVLLVANGGLGSTYDVLTLNQNLCNARGVRVRAVLLNKVKPDKTHMVREYINKALTANSWDASILGVVPFADTLDQPSVLDLEQMFDTRALAGRDHLFRRFSRFELVTTSLRRLLDKLGDGGIYSSSTCFVTHASRHDIILGLLSHSQDTLDEKNSATPFDAGLILTGTPPGHIPHSFVSDCISGAAIPVLSVGMSTTKAMQKLDGFTSKMNVKDHLRTLNVIDHYEPFIDFDALLACARVPPRQRG